MYLLKPSWLAHKGESRKFEIYSVSIAPDGKRIASGGLDGKVRVWSTDAVLSAIKAEKAQTAAKDANQEPKAPDEPYVGPHQLCSMSTHTGAVTVVRFSPSGRYLASGSDDRVVLIWERDESRIPVQEFGSTSEADTESWVARKRLIGHDNDIQDLAWSPDSSLLVTVGLDSSIHIWSGTTFEKLRRFDAHESHVKGITFDPANKYFATASDDRTMRIIRYHRPSPNEITFSIEATISTPFVDSPLSTYFRRCSWSPDGNHIAAANATNGPVATTAVINRGTWDSDISLVGHEAPCEVASFCPRVFALTKLDSTKSTQTASGEEAPKTITVVATAGQDKTLSIWNTMNPRPLLVARNVAEKPITDIAWSPDGGNMYVSSLDGSILVVAFEDGELGWPIPIEEAQLQLTRYGGAKDDMQIPETVEQIVLEEKIAEREKLDNTKKMDEIMGAPTGIQSAPVESSASLTAVTPVSAPATNGKAAEPVKAKLIQHKVTITKDGKKRVLPTLVSGSVEAKRPVLMQTAAAAAPGEPHLHVMELSEPSHALPKGGVHSLIVGNRKRQQEGDEEANGTANGSTAKKQKTEEVPEFIRPAVVSPASTVSQVRLAVPKVQTFFGRGTPGTSERGAVLEVRNGTGNEQEPTKITVTKRGQVVFVDFLPKYGHLAAGDGVLFWSVATEDGTIYLYSPSGRRIMPCIALGCPLTFLESQGPYLLAMTSVGMVQAWNVRERRCVLPAVSVAAVLDAGSKLQDSGLVAAPSITRCGISKDGKVVLTLSSGHGYTYNGDMQVWQRVSESWWVFGSQYWDSTGSDSGTGGLVGLMERRTNQEVLNSGRRRLVLERLAKNRMLQEGYEGFESVVSIGHLETRIESAVLLQSREELRRYMTMYARRIGEEGMKERLDELCRELMSAPDTVCGIEKREMLREVLLAAGKFREVQQVVLRFARAAGIDLEDGV